MRRIVVALTVGLGLAASARAADAPKRPSGPVIAEEVAERLRADGVTDAEFRGVVARGDPDPWIVAEVLLSRREPEVARRLAGFVPAPEGERLRTYLDRRAGEAFVAEETAALAGAPAAMAARRYAEVVERVRPPMPPRSDVTWARLGHARAFALQRLGRHAESAEHYEAASEVAERLGWTRRAAMLARFAMEPLRDGGSPDRALTSGARAVALARADGNHREHASAVMNRVSQLMSLGEHARAREEVEDGIRAADRSDDPSLRVRLRLQRGTLRAGLEGSPAALDAVDEATAIARASGDSALLALAGNDLAWLLDLLGQSDRARAVSEEALAAARRSGDARALIAVLRCASGVELSLGRGDRARALSDEAVRLAGSLGDRYVIATARLSEARILRTLGDPTAAAAALREAAAVFLDPPRYPDYFAATELLGTTLFEKGDLAGAAETFRAGLALARRHGFPLQTVTLLSGLGSALHGLGQDEEARAAFLECVETYERAGLREKAGRELSNLGIVEAALGDFDSARGRWDHAARLAREFGNPQAVSEAEGALADALLARGDLAGARSHVEEALRAAGAHGDPARRGHVLRSLSRLESRAGNRLAARRSLDEARGLFLSVGARREAGQSAVELAPLVGLDGDPRGAVRLLEEAVHAFRDVGDETSRLAALVPLASWLAEAGEHGREGATIEDLVSALPADPSPMRADALHAAASWHRDSGRLDEAERLYRESLATLDALRASGRPEPRGEARSRHGLAKVAAARGVPAPEIERMLTTALAQAQETGDAALVGGLAQELGAHRYRTGDPAGALAPLRRAAEAYGSLPWPRKRASARVGEGHALVRLDRTEEGIDVLESALAALGAEDAWDVIHLAESGIAWARMKQGRPRDALAAAKRAVEALGAGDTVLADEEAAVRRRAFRIPVALGVQAAGALQDVDAALWFLERGRAGALLDTLSAQGRSVHEVLPPDVVRAERAARDREGAARRAVRAAELARDAAAFGTARDALRRAEEERQALLRRMQREQKRAWQLLGPEQVAAPVLRELLGPDEAFVAYSIGAGSDTAWALVLTREGGRLVDLGTAEDVVDAADRLRSDVRAPDHAGRAGRLADLVTVPLGLSPKHSRVLVVPDDTLGFLPFGQLMNGRDVAMVPSGTVLAWLRVQERPGRTGVLALGAPDYGVPDAAKSVAVLRDEPLVPLPGTEAEARAVGTRVLVGREATRKGLVAGLEEREWAAVHFACHGVLDATRRQRTSLALTPTADDDGFLTPIDVCRMSVRADLVVLSACETARGEVAAGEGILGMTRSFMIAGAPRVVASLWRVDDEATRVLMTEFYGFWRPKDGSPGLPTARALRLAQESVQSVPRWSHPRFWAGWTLWGLPE